MSQQNPVEPTQARIIEVREADVVEPQAEFFIVDILRVFWWGKWIIAATILVCVTMAALLVHNLEPTYTARMILASRADASGQRLMGQIAGLAQLIGVGRGLTAQSSLWDEFVGTVTSVTLARRLEERYQLLREIYRGSWDAESETWVAPKAEGWLAEFRLKVDRYLNVPGWTEPDERVLAGFLSGVRVRPFEATALKELVFEHPDPQFALRLLNIVFNEADTLLREREQRKVAEQIKYLWAKLETISVFEHRTALVSLLGAQERRMMLLQDRTSPFVADIIDHPTVSTGPTWPKPFLMLYLAFAAGLLLGPLLAVFVRALRATARG